MTTPDCPKPAVYGRSLLPCLLPIIRSWPLVTWMALQIISSQLHLQIRYLWTNLPSKLPQIRYSGTSIGQILGPQIRYFWTRNGLSFPGPVITYTALYTIQSLKPSQISSRQPKHPHQAKTQSRPLNRTPLPAISIPSPW